MKVEDRERCNGKLIYKSQNEARKVRQIVNKKRKVKLRIYLCDCHGWHLTSEPKFVRLRKGKTKRNKYENPRDFKKKRSRTDW